MQQAALTLFLVAVSLAASAHANSNLRKAFNLQTASLSSHEARLLDHLSKATAAVSVSDAKAGAGTEELGNVIASLIGLLVRNDTEVNSTTTKIVGTHVQSIVDDIQGIIPTKSEALAKGLKASLESFSSCDVLLAQRLEESKSTEKLLPERREAHTSCRKKESDLKVELDSCTKESNQAVQSMKDDPQCVAWPAMQGASVDAVQSECSAVKEKETYEEYLERIKSEFDNKLLLYRGLKAACDVASSFTVPTCEDETAKHTKMQSDCNQLQILFETISCRRANQVETSWMMYNQCYDMALNNYATSTKRAEEETKSHKNEYAATMRIECLLEGLKVQTDAERQKVMDDCKSKEFSTDALKVDIPKAPERKLTETIPAENLPGSKDFASKEYSSISGVQTSMNCTVRA